MKVIFIRHGESEANVLQAINADVNRVVHLTEKGKKQALEAGKKLKDKGIEVIFCSPFVRTRETAELINKTLNKEIIIDERLKELNSGLEGENIEVYHEAQLKSGMTKLEFRLEGKESFKDVSFRIADFLEELKAMDFETVLVVTHEASLMVASLALGDETDIFLERFGNCEFREIILDS